jgi:hypothetical protein
LAGAAVRKEAADPFVEEADELVAQLNAYAERRDLAGLADLHWPWVAACVAMGLIILYSFLSGPHVYGAATDVTYLKGFYLPEIVGHGTIRQYPDGMGSRIALVFAVLLTFVGLFVLPRKWSIRYREAMLWRRYTGRGPYSISREFLNQSWRAASSSVEKLLRKDDFVEFVWLLPAGAALFGLFFWLRGLEAADVETVSARGFETSMFWTSRRISHGFDQVKWISLQCGEIQVGGRGGKWVTMARVTYRFQNTHRITVSLPADSNEKFKIMLAVDEALRRLGTRVKFDTPYSKECVVQLTQRGSLEFEEEFARILHLDDWRARQ